MEQYVSSFDGTRLYSIHHPGTKPLTLFFLHGVGGNWTIWKKEIEFFKSKGYPILTQDLRGHGKSEYPKEFKGYSLPHFTKDIKVLLNSHNIENFALIGHSLGGSIGITYCVQNENPYPKSLILIESAAHYPFKHDRILNYNPYITHIVRFISEHTHIKTTYFPDLIDIDLSNLNLKTKFNFLRYLLHSAPIKAIVDTLDNVEKFVHKNQKKVDWTLQNLKIPTLLIAGDNDHTVPLEYSKYIKNLNKNAEFRIVKDDHHKVTSEHPKEVCDILYRFVENKLQIMSPQTQNHQQAHLQNKAKSKPLKKLTDMNRKKKITN